MPGKVGIYAAIFVETLEKMMISQKLVNVPAVILLYLKWIYWIKVVAGGLQPRKYNPGGAVST